MASYSSVMKCVEAEIELCEQMAGTLAGERKAVADLSYVDLAHCIRQRRLIEVEWRSITRQRRAHLAELVPEGGTLGELAELMPAEERDRLLRLGARLRGLVAGIKREQRINLALVRSSLAIVGETLKLVRRGEEPVYDGSAALVGAGAGAYARWRA